MVRIEQGGYQEGARLVKQGSAFSTTNILSINLLLVDFRRILVVSDTWIKRLQEYLVKVVREAKVKSNWESPAEKTTKMHVHEIY